MFQKLVIVIPIYKSTLQWFEEIAIKQAIKILHQYDHLLITPTGLAIEDINGWYQAAGKRYKQQSFEPGYFASTASYNQLMLSSDFYTPISHYTYHLIYQTDAFVFRDDLLYWCKQGYDYIGAPWVNWIHAAYPAKNSSFSNRLLWLLGKRRFDAVGNGGFSLRKTASIIKLLTTLKEVAGAYKHNEDFFFAFEAAKYGEKLHMPAVKKALRFAFDENPELAWNMNKQQLPMGCHAWPRNWEFWKPFIERGGKPSIDVEPWISV